MKFCRFSSGELCTTPTFISCLWNCSWLAHLAILSLILAMQFEYWKGYRYCFFLLVHVGLCSSGQSYNCIGDRHVPIICYFVDCVSTEVHNVQLDTLPSLGYSLSTLLGGKLQGCKWKLKGKLLTGCGWRALKMDLSLSSRTLSEPNIR